VRRLSRRKSIGVSIVAIGITAGLALTITLLITAPEPKSHDVSTHRNIPSAVPSLTPAPTAKAVIVQAAPPTHLSVPVLGIDTAVLPYTVREAAHGSDGVTGKACLIDGVIRCVDPQSLSDVSWQIGGIGGVAFGSEPGTDAAGTVYIYGHAATGAKAVFNELGNLKSGDTATVTTANGLLTYQVQRSVDTAKSAFVSTPEAVDQVSGRLLLISCDHRRGVKLVNGGYSTGNIIVVLQLEQP
jgi:LPXTG-site transpeptidase (sortase) family protein